MFFRVIRPLLPLIPIGIAAVTVCTLGVGIIRFRRGATRWDALTSAALDVLLGAAVLGVLVLTLPPSIGAPRSVELIPFRGVLHRGTKRAEMLANVLLFVPLGLLAPARWTVFDRWPSLVAGAFALSAGIEVAQLASNLGRQASLTDIILNTVGACLGYGLLLTGRRVLRRFRRARSFRASG
jgi:glycopeptide antibiotics resistance protein